MNKAKRRQANQFAVVFLLFFSGLGLLLIYRANMTDADLTRIDGLLENIETKDGHGKYGRRYAIEMDIQNQNILYGIYAGTKEQAFEKERKLHLTIGRMYSFYVDPSVSRDFNDINLGIRMIKEQDNMIYQENMKAHYVFGTLAIVMGLGSSSLLYFLGKKKFG